MSLAWVPLIFVVVSVGTYWFLGRFQSEEMSDSMSPHEGTLKSIHDWCEQRVRPYLPDSLAAWLDRRLSIAGNPGGFRAGSYTVLWLFSFAMGGYLFLFIRSRWSFQLASAVAWNVWLIWSALPYIYLYRRGTQRQREIEHALPDLLDRLDIAMNVGLPFTLAMDKVLHYMPQGALREEFERAMNEIRYGRSLEQAFRTVATRVRVPELTSFVSAVIQAHRLGVDISHVIQMQAESIRVQHRQHSEEEAAKAGTKLIFPLILVTLPMVFILLLGPILISILVGFAR